MISRVGRRLLEPQEHGLVCLAGMVLIDEGAPPPAVTLRCLLCVLAAHWIDEVGVALSLRPTTVGVERMPDEEDDTVDAMIAEKPMRVGDREHRTTSLPCEPDQVVGQISVDTPVRLRSPAGLRLEAITTLRGREIVEPFDPLAGRRHVAKGRLGDPGSVRPQRYLQRRPIHRHPRDDDSSPEICRARSTEAADQGCRIDHRIPSSSWSILRCLVVILSTRSKDSPGAVFITSIISSRPSHTE